MTKEKDTSTVQDEEVSVAVAEEAVPQAEVIADFKSAEEQAREDYEAQLPQPEAVRAETNQESKDSVGVDVLTNAAGQVVTAELLAVQERQEAELVERNLDADKRRDAEDQGPRNSVNRPVKA